AGARTSRLHPEPRHALSDAACAGEGRLSPLANGASGAPLPPPLSGDAARAGRASRREIEGARALSGTGRRPVSVAQRKSMGCPGGTTVILRHYRYKIDG